MSFGVLHPTAAKIVTKNNKRVSFVIMLEINSAQN